VYYVDYKFSPDKLPSSAYSSG